ncbi:hypothetical protein H4R33_003741 [Dimargaris cristalligena]|uniref:Macro domain-containing protein n=1 Tax=Dimargaris cristalligena TaxID=215637 RepID=A0A4P9ZZZ6_9FUNG|nr:hypothetical protein H4R33_003741 [Dimargaris cristalligena]RKP38552.1 hypothetical protein BJ085DRAFT_36718 [Dimargaris cristalligena]|eukprot:RKP38552.1 hypothetical protein BJ085DRAFT_36718 [Dimargaris cristalligena]
MSIVKVSSLPTVAQQLKSRGVPSPARVWEVVSVWRGDITHLEVDAIVNAAKNSLMGGGGVDGAIHAAAGPELVQACRQIKGGCPTGEVRITPGFRLPARQVIHTVGPVGEKPSLLKSCYEKCFASMTMVDGDSPRGIRTIAFPCISTGVYGYPARKAAELVIPTTKAWLEQDDHLAQVDRIIFCVFSESDYNLYQETIAQHAE